MHACVRRPRCPVRGFKERTSKHSSSKLRLTTSAKIQREAANDVRQRRGDAERRRRLIRMSRPKRFINSFTSQLPPGLILLRPKKEKTKKYKKRTRWYFMSRMKSFNTCCPEPHGCTSSRKGNLQQNSPYPMGGRCDRRDDC